MRLAALLLAFVAIAAAPRATLPDVEDEVMCVTCHVPLAIAESPEADRQRAYIRGLIAEGKNKEEIKDALVGQYGERVLATPAASGFDLAAWLVPALLLLAAGAALAVVLPRWRRSPRDAAPAPPLAPADAERLDEELARFDRGAPG